MLGHRAAPQTAQLGKHEPHPMAAFAAISQFTADPFHKGVLRLNEAVEHGSGIGSLDTVRPQETI
jgi:hypothetical protein